MIFSFIFDTDLQADHKTNIRTKIFLQICVIFWANQNPF